MQFFPVSLLTQIMESLKRKWDAQKSLEKLVIHSHDP